jgi:arabinofuranosyltransferase
MLGSDTFGVTMERALQLSSVLASSAVLMVFARWFDFQCDDAFIAFRYAQNWVEHGEIAYNLGERVEGYTSFAWVTLLAGMHRMGVSLPNAAKVLGMLSGVLLLVGTAQLGKRLFTGGRLGQIALLAMVACNASIAAWTLGGLETPLFAGLVVFSIVVFSDWARTPTVRRAAAAGLWVALATLTRPEGIYLFAGMALWWVVAVWRKQQVSGSPAFVLLYASIVGGHLLWRRTYYGDFLPNVYYVKTTGVGEALRSRGISYLGFCASELGVVFVGIALVLLMVPRLGKVKPAEYDAARFLSRVFVASILVHVMAVGGDFLDLYRFLVPIIPLVLAVALDAALGYTELLPHARTIQAVTAPLLLAWYVPQQVVLASRAKVLSESGRKAQGIEPLGWTATYARRWAATGRWIHEHAKPGDWLAVGAAGAMPFYSQLANIDTFGLCDAYVARHGNVIGVRPGHQRFAPLEYLLQRSPTFLLINDYATEHPTRFKSDPVWEQRGYVWVEAHVRQHEHGAPSSFYHYLLVRSDRASELQNRPLVRVAAP